MTCLNAGLHFYVAKYATTNNGSIYLCKFLIVVSCTSCLFETSREKNLYYTSFKTMNHHRWHKQKQHCAWCACFCRERIILPIVYLKPGTIIDDISSCRDLTGPCTMDMMGRLHFYVAKYAATNNGSIYTWVLMLISICLSHAQAAFLKWTCWFWQRSHGTLYNGYDGNATWGHQAQPMWRWSPVNSSWCPARSAKSFGLVRKMSSEQLFKLWLLHQILLLCMHECL